MSDLELLVVLTTLIHMSGDEDLKVRVAVKGFYQSLVACADRSRVGGGGRAQCR